MLVSIIYTTKRPGSIDVLFESLSRQSNQNYELLMVDEIAPFRHEKVVNYAKERNINLTFHDVGKVPDNPQLPFRFASAVNTGLLHCKGDVVVFLQDYTWVPVNAINRVIQFFEKIPLALWVPLERHFLPPEEYINQKGLDDNNALTIFTSNLVSSPISLQWKENVGPSYFRPWNPEFKSVKDITKSEYWEMFFGAVSYILMQELNGIDEAMDAGDDAHERNVLDRARMLGYESYIDPQVVMEEIEHRHLQDNNHWHRYPQDTNLNRWYQQMLPSIIKRQYPIRSPNKFNLPKH